MNDRTHPPASVYSVDRLINEARRLAVQYRETTGKPLPGITSEIAEYEAARSLDLELCRERSAGYDAVGRGMREGRRVQIKGRAILDEKKSSQRIGQLKVDQEWDSVLLVLMDEQLEPYEMYEAEREAIMDAVGDAKASKRARRGLMSVARFKNIARLVWTREHGVEEDEIWDNRTSR